MIHQNVPRFWLRHCKVCLFGKDDCRGGDGAILDGFRHEPEVALKTEAAQGMIVRQTANLSQALAIQFNIAT